MSTDNTVAERLLTDARKKGARRESSTLAKVALATSILAVLSLLVMIYPFALAWPLGAAAVVMGGIATKRAVGKRMAWIACTIGFLAICGGTFFYTLVISHMR
jgi:hypothetical protein